MACEAFPLHKGKKKKKKKKRIEVIKETEKSKGGVQSKGGIRVAVLCHPDEEDERVPWRLIWYGDVRGWLSF